MKDMVVQAKDPKSGKTAQVTVKTGSNAGEMIQMFGDEAVASNANSNWTVTLQGSIRAGLRKGETQEQLQARLGGAKMGVKVSGAKIDPKQAYLAAFASATPEEQAKMLKELQQRAQKAAGK